MVNQQNCNTISIAKIHYHPDKSVVYDNFDEILLDTCHSTLIHHHPYKPHTNPHSDHLFDYFYLNYTKIIKHSITKI